MAKTPDQYDSINAGPGLTRLKNGSLYYNPTPEEIRKRCLEIQETWSDYERFRRAGGREEMYQYEIRSAKVIEQ